MLLRFLGCGNASAIANGESAAVLEIPANNTQLTTLCIDYGKDAHQTFYHSYQKWPDAIFITHTHIDHIGGLEALFFKQIFDHERQDKIKLFVPIPLIPALYRRIVTEECQIAEGGRNFFDAFQLIPVEQGFWYQDYYFNIFEVRHFAPKFCYGLSLTGSFLYTADTKVIPEVLNHYARSGEMIFHDVSFHKNPAHAYIEELEVYSHRIKERLWLYHYADDAPLEQYKRHGYKFVRPDMVFDLKNKCALNINNPPISLTNAQAS